MSFRDAVSLEAQPLYSDSPEFDELASDLSNLIYEINNKLSSLSNLVSNFEKNLSNESTYQAKIQPLLAKLTSSFKRLHELTTSFKQYIDDTLSPSQLFTKNKLLTEVAKSFNHYNIYQKKFNNLIKQVNDEQRQALLEESNKHELNETNGAGDQQLQINQPQISIEYEPINAEELEYQQNLILEREQEIQNIENGIEELNVIFTDLSTIVNEQGLVIDNIESNMYDISSNTRVAADELNKALRYQSKSRGRAFCCLMILVILLLIIILAISLG